MAPHGPWQVGPPRPRNLSWCPGSRLELAEEALKRYEADPLYRCLLERTGQLFAAQLREDLGKMKRGRGLLFFGGNHVAMCFFLRNHTVLEGMDGL